jgi:hypothetical protein
LTLQLPVFADPNHQYNTVYIDSYRAINPQSIERKILNAHTLPSVHQFFDDAMLARLYTVADDFKNTILQHQIDTIAKNIKSV